MQPYLSNRTLENKNYNDTGMFVLNGAYYKINNNEADDWLYELIFINITVSSY